MPTPAEWATPGAFGFRGWHGFAEAVCHRHRKPQFDGMTRTRVASGTIPQDTSSGPRGLSQASSDSHQQAKRGWGRSAAEPPAGRCQRADYERISDRGVGVPDSRASSRVLLGADCGWSLAEDRRGTSQSDPSHATCGWLCSKTVSCCCVLPGAWGPPRSEPGQFRPTSASKAWLGSERSGAPSKTLPACRLRAIH